MDDRKYAAGFEGDCGSRGVQSGKVYVRPLRFSAIYAGDRHPLTDVVERIQAMSLIGATGASAT